MSENIIFHARDNTNLVSTFWQGNGPSVILLHQFNKDRHSYDSFAQELHKNGFSVLSFDFRGFGESGLNKDQFDVNDFLSLVSDVKAAKRFLEERNSNTEKIFIIGASIGANTAMNYAPIDSHVEGIVLLSPGLEYKGIKIEESAKQYQGNIFLVSSEGDEYSNKTVHKIMDIAKTADKEIKIYPGSAHGTDLFYKSDLNKLIIDWMKGLSE